MTSENKKNSPPQSNNGKGDGNGKRLPLGIFLIVPAILLLFYVLQSSKNKSNEIDYDTFRTHATNQAFVDQEAIISGNQIQAVLSSDYGHTVEERLRNTEVPVHSVIDSRAMDSIYAEMREIEGLKITFEESGNSYQLIFYAILQLLPIVLILLFFFIMYRAAKGGGGPGGMLGNFGRSKHKMLTKDKTGVTLDMVKGIDEAREEVSEVIAFLKDPAKFQRLGGRVPRGILLSGSPGCGKTLLAKAVAGEADVPFFTLSGSDFVEMFVGVGASRVRDLFNDAKSHAPCIVFLDEIDAIGRKRGGGMGGGGNDEREQTLNAILVEMDGFDSDDGVIVMAATNRVDVLDEALTRPGRFDRQIHVPLPDIKGRRDILEVHAKKIKVGPDVDLQLIARGTPSFSGAQLASLINEAAIIATMEDKPYVEHVDFEEARDKVKWGRANKSRKIEEEERIATAYHEAGHAVLQLLLDDADELHKVTIIPRGPYGGATFSLPKDQFTQGYKYGLATLRVMCGGRIAEEQKTGDITSGARGDIGQASAWARMMVKEWGMSDAVGFIDYSDNNGEFYKPNKDFSEETQLIIDKEVRRLIDEAYADAERVLKENWDFVDRMSIALLEHETLTRDQCQLLRKGETLSKTQVTELLNQELAKSIPPVAKNTDSDNSKSTQSDVTDQTSSVTESTPASEFDALTNHSAEKKSENLEADSNENKDLL